MQINLVEISIVGISYAKFCDWCWLSGINLSLTPLHHLRLLGWRRQRSRGATASKQRGDDDGEEGRRRRSCRRGNESQRDGRRWSGNDRIWERRTATEREWPELRLCRRRHPNNRRVSFSHLISSMWFLGCVLEKWNSLLFSVSYVLFFFFGCNVELRFFEQK